MKTNAQIFHDFATGSNENGRGSNVFYITDKDGRTLYSYGYHFAIARITRGVCLFTKRGYSVTTAKHISGARGALSHYKLIFCAYPDAAGPRLNFEYWERELKATEKDLATARNKGARVLVIQNILHEITEYCAATDCKRPAFYSHYMRITKTGDATKAVQMQVKKERENEKKRKEIERLATAERVQKWENGENIYLRFDETENNVPLRLEKRKGYTIIMTAKGVPVTIPAALEFYAQLKAGKIEQYQRINTGGASFTVREITNNIIKIGCHTFNIEYLDTFRAKLSSAA